ncbi:hypothetical protein MHT86_04780 [Corynebacterium mastitidis]|uniref:Uncharacterized protein n=1 Tax=Corynebacterium mastitidis TaxID=161890 RepID=A0A2N0X8A0_9CORY|nr:hypothetical protein [Corynebacterium mastitidis]MCH6196815.1 hypothetical protein [Corynebacterium mastitidis]PKF68941.1 hypothetical protein CXB45_04330 [Corynebacterium mastitidis]
MLLSALMLSATALHAPVYQEPIEPQPIAVPEASVAPEAPQTAVGEPAQVEALGEAHLFSGSGTSVEAFTAWFAGEDFVEPDGGTKDYRPLTLPNGQVAHGGDVIVKDAHGQFRIA